MEEQEHVAVIAAEVEADASFLEELRQRVEALESALGELRSVSAHSVAAGATSGRKTMSTAARPEMTTALDAALGSLSLEQRIAVKGHLMRSGLL